MNKFIVFNDSQDSVIDISKIVTMWIDSETIYMEIEKRDGELNVAYESDRKALKDYNALIKLLSAIEISEYYKDIPKKKPSLKQQAMKEVNEFLGKSRTPS